jgi:hypothetical protein
MSASTRGSRATTLACKLMGGTSKQFLVIWDRTAPRAMEKKCGDP